MARRGDGLALGANARPVNMWGCQGGLSSIAAAGVQPIGHQLPHFVVIVVVVVVGGGVGVGGGGGGGSVAVGTYVTHVLILPAKTPTTATTDLSPAMER